MAVSYPSIAPASKLIGAITKSDRPRNLFYGKCIIQEPNCNLFMFRIALLRFKHLLFWFMDWCQCVGRSLYLMVSSKGQAMSSCCSPIKWPQFNNVVLGLKLSCALTDVLILQLHLCVREGYLVYFFIFRERRKDSLFQNSLVK